MNKLLKPGKGDPVVTINQIEADEILEESPNHPPELPPFATSWALCDGVICVIDAKFQVFSWYGDKEGWKIDRDFAKRPVEAS